MIHTIAAEYKSALRSLYGQELAELVLYGSYARGEERSDSDMDFAVVLRDPGTRSTAELLKTSRIDAELSLKYGVIISSLPVSLQKKQTSMQGVFQDIRKEGILILS